MQRIFNYGSFLQAYGLKSILGELGCSVEFVDYHPGKCLISMEGGQGLSRKVSKGLEVFKYRAPLKEKLRFIKYKKNYAANYFSHLGIGDTLNYTSAVDLLVIGSDEVFNCVQNNPNVGFSPELFGVGNQAKRAISYAASFGNTTLAKLEKYGVSEEVGKWLNALDAVSVRDANSGSVVEGLTSRSPLYHLDPALAYDYMGSCKQIPATVPESNYMILYGYSGRFSRDECEAVRAYADAHDLKVFCIGGVQDCCDRFIDCSPFEVLAYFKNAKAVVTDTFHGTIFSVITHRQFATIVRSSGYGNAEKLPDLLQRLGLNDRILTSMTNLGTMLKAPIDYDPVDSFITGERKRTYDYLRKEIEACTLN